MFNLEFWQWSLLIVSSLVMFLVSPLAKTVQDFFKPDTTQAHAPGIFVLSSSLIISWIFAKSITNAAGLGKDLGMVGAVAYGAYYLSFLVAGIVIYKLRTKGKFTSLHQFLSSKFGKQAVKFFSVLIAIRLFNEVWSNTMVIGSYFGSTGSSNYYWSILVFTALTLAYVLKGGMRTSLLTDAIQMMLFAVLLILILGKILPAENYDVGKFVKTGTWNQAGGINLLWVVLLQVLSYPFHDPVLTDRGFLSSPKTTLISYVVATTVGFICIILFSFTGIFAQLQGIEGEPTFGVAQSFGLLFMLLMNFIMITSASSTLDSTFTSFAKLAIIDLKTNKLPTIKAGRIAMISLAVLGSIPVFLGPEILSATTISGSMVIGLAPIFILWWMKVPAYTFTACVTVGFIVGLSLAFDIYPKQLVIFEGKYAELLSANLLGTISCFVVYLLAYITQKERKNAA